MARTRKTRTRRRRNSTRVTVISPRRNAARRRHTRRRNPMLFGQSVRPMELGKSIVGGLLGVTVAKLVPPMLPASLTGSAALRVIVTGAIAFGAGMLANKMNPNFGSAVTFGGLMQTASVALNAFIPSIGSQIGLSGMGRIGDLVPGGFPMPQNPVNYSALAPPPMPVMVANAGKGVSGFGRSF